ncbi:MAG: hypothetical protein WD972_00120 [Candidatus Andersenbacteria bacterium]
MAKRSHKKNTSKQFDERIEDDLTITHCGTYKLSRGIRFSTRSPIKLQEGYCFQEFEGEAENPTLLLAAVSAEKLFRLFIDLWTPIGKLVTVTLESTHDDALQPSELKTYINEKIEPRVLESTLWDYEDLTVNDGFLAISISNQHKTKTVKFTDEKLLIVMCKDLEAFEEIVMQAGIPLIPDLKTVRDDRHAHLSNATYKQQLQELRVRLSATTLGGLSDF